MPGTMLATIYPWVKALHVISIIVWMGAQIALFQVLAMHRAVAGDPGRARMLAEVERRLIRRMLNPGIVAAFIFGGAMLLIIGIMEGRMPGWLIVKLILAVLLSAMHGMLIGECRRIADKSAGRSFMAGRRAELINLGMLLALVGLVIIKPSL